MGWPVARQPGVARGFLLVAGSVSTILDFFWGAPLVACLF